MTQFDGSFEKDIQEFRATPEVNSPEVTQLKEKPSVDTQSAQTAAAKAKAESAAGRPRNVKRNPHVARSRGKGEAGLEREIEAAEATLRTIEDELADPAAWASPEASARSSSRHADAKRAVAELYERWEAVAG